MRAQIEKLKLAPAKDDDWIDRVEELLDDLLPVVDLARELAAVYTVDTDQAALIRLVARAKQLTQGATDSDQTPPAESAGSHAPESPQFQVTQPGAAGQE